MPRPSEIRGGTTNRPALQEQILEGSLTMPMSTLGDGSITPNGAADIRPVNGMLSANRVRILSVSEFSGGPAQAFGNASMIARAHVGGIAAVHVEPFPGTVIARGTSYREIDGMDAPTVGNLVRP